MRIGCYCGVRLILHNRFALVGFEVDRKLYSFSADSNFVEPRLLVETLNHSPVVAQAPQQAAAVWGHVGDGALERCGQVLLGDTANCTMVYR